MIHPSNAWTLARLLAGYSVNGELKTIAEPYRRLAEHLDGLPPDARQAAWDAAMTGREDGFELISAVAKADPDQPQPESHRDDETTDAWGPIRLGSMPLAEPFPLDVLPEAASTLVKEGAHSIGCPPDFIAVAMLAVAGGTIGRSVSLLLKSQYFARASLYVACIGSPSVGKTPAFKLAAEGVRRIGSHLAEEHAQSMERWNEESNQAGPKGPKSTPPRPRRIDIDDITMEAVPMRLSDNPRGLIMLRDELSALLLGMNQYKGGKGSDRAVLLKIWSGDAITRDRVPDVSGIPICCPHPCMSILGGLPPDMLGSLHDGKGSADGFIDRFLFTYPEPTQIPPWSEYGAPEESIDEWCELVARLWQRSLKIHEGRAVPHAAFLTPEAKSAWRSLHDAHSAEMNAPGFPPSMLGPWGKLKEYAGRLTLILACLYHASDPTANPADVPTVGPDAVRNAWRLVEYFKNHAQRVHFAIGQGLGIGATDAVKAIVKWLHDGRRLSFSESKIKQDRRWITDDDLETALRFLTDRNVIRPREIASERPKGGRPPSPAYDVNPSLLDTENSANPRNASE